MCAAAELTISSEASNSMWRVQKDSSLSTMQNGGFGECHLDITETHARLKGHTRQSESWAKSETKRFSFGWSLVWCAVSHLSRRFSCQK